MSGLNITVKTGNNSSNNIFSNQEVINTNKSSSNATARAVKEVTAKDKAFTKNYAEEDRQNEYKVSLNNKLKNGGTLTVTETEFLKKEAPELYKESKQIAREQQTYEAKISNATSIEEVNGIKADTIEKYADKVREVATNPNLEDDKKLVVAEKISTEFNAVMSKHSEFVQSEEYAELNVENTEKSANKMSTLEFYNMKTGKGKEITENDVKDQIKELVTSTRASQINKISGNSTLDIKI